MDFDVTSIMESVDAENGTSAENINKTTSLALAEMVEAEDKQMLPPEHLFSDYIELAYLGAVIIAGLALNFCVLKRLLRERRFEERSGRPKNGFVLLKLNLNISDLLILLIHATGKFGWLITYEWRGGEHLCRLFNFLSMFTLYLSSNIVICIAVDRLLTALKAQKINTGKRKLNLVRLMLLLAWSFSILFSLPQLFVWTTYNPFRLPNSQGWVQCTDIWSIDRYERYLVEQSAAGKKEMEKGNRNIVLSTAVQNGYELAHLFLVFYGPLIVLIFCYALISTRLIRFAANNPRNSALQQSSNENAPLSGVNITENGRKYCKRASIKSFPAVKLYAPLADQRRRKSHHSNVPLIDIHEVSTRAEETSISISTEKSSYVQCQKCQIDEADDSTTPIAPLMKGCKHRPLNNSLPIYGIRTCRNEIVKDEFLGAKTILVHCNYPLNGGILHSCSSNSSLSTVAFQQSTKNCKKQQKRILVRLRDSFRNSFNQRFHNQSAGNQLKANLAFHCSATSLNGIDHQCKKAKEKQQKEKGFLWWNICQRLANWLNICNRKREDADGNGLNGHSPICDQNDSCCPRPDEGLCRQSIVNHSIRSSFSTTATVGGTLDRAESRIASTALPLWRRHFRSRAFRATLFVILAHVLLWSPYNLYALMKHINERMYERMSEQANVLKDLQFLIVLINPFLYGFGRRVQGKERTGAAGGGVERQRTGGL